jgi:SAM-dependent methyltransferase
MAKKKAGRRRKSEKMASMIDPHRLYELSVQSPETEVRFISRRFKALRGRPARLLREDFCGTAAVCCEWARLHRDNQAIGVDLDPDVLAWGRRHNLTALNPGQFERVSLLQADVMTARTAKMDVVLAMNFSYWLFTDRESLKQYFRSVFKSLRKDGVFFLDSFGGYDAFREMTEDREIEEDGLTFTYTWDQAQFNPIDNRMLCHIHFSFPDGSKIRKAFSYHWRIWTLPEVRELLEECGFRNVTFYWQGFDENDEPDGRFRPAKKADADAGWICYITAER